MDWRPDQSRICLEQERIAAEGYEIGVFRTVEEAAVFAERYLVGEESLQAIEVERKVVNNR